MSQSWTREVDETRTNPVQESTTICAHITNIYKHNDGGLPQPSYSPRPRRSMRKTVVEVAKRLDELRRSMRDVYYAAGPRSYAGRRKDGVTRHEHLFVIVRIESLRKYRSAA